MAPMVATTSNASGSSGEPLLFCASCALAELRYLCMEVDLPLGA
eukprot:CAMPEP_0194417852 /NCGR_PEP_ID=MMETSP0176-20130528/16905_1 /TAXON_ID=216777 /ORGANISM="Proboscia alata, Strain PI-D3" /LENGTH=43 /DNA_ID= /DNA_START= /DNA_END= /DNA_ORIENTATION=